MDDMKKAGREVETDAKKATRNWDGEDLADKVGNAGDEIRKDLGNAGDDVSNAVDDATDKAHDTADGHWTRRPAESHPSTRRSATHCGWRSCMCGGVAVNGYR